MKEVLAVRDADINSNRPMRCEAVGFDFIRSLLGGKLLD